jgi:ribonuclease R
VIRNRKRFTYEEVQAILNDLAIRERERPEELHASGPTDITTMLRRMRDLALLLRKKRLRRGSLELSMPEAVLEYDDQGRVSGAHFAEHNLSHQIIEEFMLAANEAVAEHFTRHEIPFLRRVHPAPNVEKLEAFAQFADLLGYPIKRPQDRFELQRVLNETADKPERAAVHFALLRSLKQAAYSPVQDEHYALASQHYCHFTSPIRRYPDLQVHRQLERWLKRKTTSSDLDELTALGEHCSKMERRAETAERELVKLKILTYLSERLGEQLDAVITGVADYGFFAQAERFPAEGLVHISSLVDDYYWYDELSHTLEGKRTKRRFRLGDRVRVEVARVDVQRRMLDFRLAGLQPSGDRDGDEVPSYGRFPRRIRKNGKRRR